VCSRRTGLKINTTKPASSIKVAVAAIGVIAAPLVCADEALFVQHCGVCHTLNPDDPPRQGPHLSNIIGRKAGAIEGFPYSGGLKSLGFNWDAEHLDQWIANPQLMASDSYMMYRQQDAAIRKKIVQFLATKN